jgi:acetyltransferase
MSTHTRSQVTPCLRPIRAEDLPLLKEFVDGLSPRTSYLRLLSPRRPSDEELRRWTDVDPSREQALIATELDGSRHVMVGVARYVLEENGDADFAIVIADNWQRRRIGRMLMLGLIRAATQGGVRTLRGVTASENTPMLALARSLGFRATRAPGSGIETHLGLSLIAPVDASSAVPQQRSSALGEAPHESGHCS